MMRSVNNAGGDIAAEYGKPDPNDGVFIKDEDVRAVWPGPAREGEKHGKEERSVMLDHSAGLANEVRVQPADHHHRP